MKLQIGLIGLGDAWETRHRPALRVLQERFDVRAVYGPVAKLAESCAAEFQADAIDGYRALVSRCDIDAVMILERSWLGWLPMLAACQAGKSIYWASDLDFDPQRDAKVRQAVVDSGVAFMAEFPRRFAPATLRLRELIATQLGAPRLVFCHRRLTNPEPKGRDGCVTDPSHRELVEAIDWCRYVVGREPATVTSTGYGQGPQPSDPQQPSKPDYQGLSLQFAATERQPAVVAQITCGSYIPATWHEAASFRPPSEMQVCCERGVAFIDLPNSLVWFDDAGRHMESLDLETPVGEQLLSQFHRTVTSLVRHLKDLDDAYQAASILAAAHRSHVEGRRIAV